MLLQEWDWDKALEVRFEEGADHKETEIVRIMLARGLKVSDISLYTGLTVEKVNLIAAIPPDAKIDTVQ